MAVTFLGLLWIQIIYMKNMVEMRYEQFSQGVKQSLLNVAVHLEQDEALYYLEKDVNQIKASSLYAQYYGDPVTQLGGVKYSFTTSTGLEANLTIKGDASEINKIRRGDKAVGRHYQNMQNVYRDHYLYQKGMLDDVILNIISTASERPIEERADSSLVRRYLREELDTLGFMLRRLEISNSDMKIDIQRKINALYEKIDEEGLDFLYSSFFTTCERFLDLPRKTELAALINRMRKVKVAKDSGADAQ